MPGQDLAPGQMAVTHDASTAVLRSEIGVAPQEGCHLGLHGLCQQGPRPVAQHLGQRVLERPWLHELDNGIVGQSTCCHGLRRNALSLTAWRRKRVTQRAAAFSSGPRPPTWRSEHKPTSILPTIRRGLSQWATAAS